MIRTTPPTQADFESLVDRIKRVTTPCRVVLFGSCARGQFGRDSDIDLLVVVPDGTDVNRATTAIYRELRGFGYGVDVVCVTETGLRLNADVPGLIYREALRDGRELYATAA